MMKAAAMFFLLPAVLGGAFCKAQGGDTGNLRGQRYCEVLLGSGGWLLPSALEVYNTIGLNDCPQALWAKLTPDSVKAETKAKFVHLNGPRYWVIDGFTGSHLVNQDVRSFGGIEMREAGILHVSLRDTGAYKRHTVARTTVEHFMAGRPVYQLISPQGEVFFMQSFSVEKQPQSMATLPELGKKLTLPKGWSFRTLTLKHDFFLKAIDGMATVVQDNLLNTYQLSTAHASDDL